MTAPRLYSCWFEVAGPGAWPATWYERHARVLEYSARVNSPGWTVDVRKIGRPTPRRAALGGGSTSSYIYNTHKLEDWWGAVRDAADGDRILLIDADTMILRPLDPVWDTPFDVAITVKTGVTRLPMNAGVVFVRVNPRSRVYIEAWWTWNLRLLGNRQEHLRYRRTYAGMNQAALGALMEHEGPRLATVAELRCEQWNCETATWATYDAGNQPRIVHVKGCMRRGIMAPTSYRLTDPKRRAIADEWLRLERGAIDLLQGQRAEE